MYKTKEVDDLNARINGLQAIIDMQETEIVDLKEENEKLETIKSVQDKEIAFLNKVMQDDQTMVITSNKNVSINPDHVLYLFLDHRGVKSQDEETVRYDIVAMFKGGYTAVLASVKGRKAAEQELENISLILLR